MKSITKKTLLSLLVFAFINVSVFADNGNPVKKDKKKVKVTCKIIDQLTGEPLTGVKILLIESGEVFYSDFEGELELEYLNNQKSALSVSLISYEGKTIELDANQNIDIQLKRIR